jgi:hypothetical protein
MSAMKVATHPFCEIKAGQRHRVPSKAAIQARAIQAETRIATVLLSGKVLIAAWATEADGMKQRCVPGADALLYSQSNARGSSKKLDVVGSGNQVWRSAHWHCWGNHQRGWTPLRVIAHQSCCGLGQRTGSDALENRPRLLMPSGLHQDRQPAQQEGKEGEDEACPLPCGMVWAPRAQSGPNANA